MSRFVDCFAALLIALLVEPEAGASTPWFVFILSLIYFELRNLTSAIGKRNESK